MKYQVEWKPILYNGKKTNYFISNSGLIKNSSDKILSPYCINSGYMAIKLSINGSKIHFLMHRLVAEHFIPNPNNLPEVNHKDGNKHNNSYTNLEWMTKPDNMKHAAKNNLLSPKIGESSPFAIHNENQIRKACELLSTGKYTQAEVSTLTGVNTKTINGILYRGKWVHISSQYDFPRKDKTWSKEENDNILKLHNQGFSTRQIITEMNLPFNNSSKLHIRRYIKKVEASTTIPLDLK